MAGGAGETFLGLDIGTSSVKALLVDAEQRTVADASAALDVSRPQPLWSEQNADDWVEGVEAGGRRRCASSAPEAFAAARRRRPLRPDARRDLPRRRRQAAAPGDPVERRPLVRRMRRARTPRPRSAPPRRQHRHARLHRAEGAVGRDPRAESVRRDQAHPAAEGLRAAEADRRRRSRKCRTPPARCGSTSANGAGTTSCSPPPASTLSHMPSLVEGSEVSAYLSPEIAAAWGLAGRRIPVAGGAGDNAASAVGVGAIAPGEGFVSLGTSGVVFSVTDRFICLPERTLHAFCHALPDRWHGMAVMLSAAASLTWIAELSGAATTSAAASPTPRRSPSRPRRSRPRRCSCPISAASARRTTTPTRPACSPD